MSQENKNLDDIFSNNQINLQKRFGVVMFDLVEDHDGKLMPMPGAGWASISGKSSFRIKDTNDLDKEIKWLTNLNQETLWKSGAVKQTKLKHSAYLRTDVGQIMKDLGLTTPKYPIAKICETISEIFTKVMNLAIEYYDLKEFNQKELYTELRMSLLPEDRNISIHVDEALTRSYQELIICQKPVLKEKHQFVTLRRPRYFHAKSILETSIPYWDSEWDFIGPDDLPVNHKDRIAFLMAQEKPFVAKVNILEYQYQDKINLDIKRLMDLGVALGEGGKSKERNWVSQPELLYLSKFTNISVEAAFLAKGYQSLEKMIELPYLGELSDFSYSVGLLAECVWIGLATRSVNPQTRTKTLVSPRACWLKAADKFMTLTSAMMLSSAGFEVTSYGYGGVTILLEESRLNNLIEIAPHTGLCVPTNLIEKRNVIFT